MSILAITIPIHTYDSEGNTAEHIKSLLSGIRFDWEFYGERAQFSSFVCVRKKKNNIYKHELMLLKKLMGILPDDTDLQNEYKKYLILDKGAFEYDVELNFKGEIAVEIDIENNSALYYNGPKLQNLKHRDILFLKKHINDEMLDDFYERKTKSFVLAIVMSLVIAYPEIDINNATAIVKFDEKKYREESFFSYYPIQNEAIAKYKNLMDVDVSFNDCFKWIKEHTSLEKEDYNTPTIFSSLTYVFNREMHEILVYSIIGLESIYAPKHGAVSYSLQNNISTVFPSVTKEEIKNLYKMRSEFVHGNCSVGSCQLIEETVDLTEDFVASSRLATALLIATIRKLIKNDSKGIKFWNTISFEYEH